MNTQKTETATFGAGCFWCVEAIFQRLKGVEKVIPGYAGGTTQNPTYEQVCTGTTGHAEVAQITCDPAVISYDQLLDVFFHTHNPTTLNRQGNDVGDQYRSAIFYQTDEQKQSAERIKKEEIDESKEFEKPIVTEIVPLTKFYPAENYHRGYFNQNPSKGYCQLVITPKIEKFKHSYSALLKQPSAILDTSKSPTTTTVH